MKTANLLATLAYSAHFAYALNGTCPGTFTPITAQAWLDAAAPGYNIGDTMDAIPTEGSWDNAPPITSQMLAAIKSGGFKSIRLPVTWSPHYITGSPSWTVNPSWMKRVSDVIDMSLALGLPVIVNMHHDSWMWADVSQPSANLTMIQEKFAATWKQIGTALGCKCNRVAFEPLNEPPGKTAQDAANYQKLTTIFLDSVNAAGGFNAQRVVTLSGLKMDSTLTSQYFKVPTNYSNPISIQHHVYTPYMFVFDAWGRTIWGSDADKAEIEEQIGSISRNFSVPVFIGEYSGSTADTEPAARWKYHDFVVRTAKKYNQAVFLWDNGGDFLKRKTGVWRDPIVNSIITEASVGTVNSLPDSTTDTSLATEFTSAYVFHQLGTPVVDYELPYLFNGNKLTSISNGHDTLRANIDYRTSNNSITMTAQYLSTLIDPTCATGSKANLTLTFSAGSPTSLNIVQWDTPTIAKPNITVSASDTTIYGYLVHLHWNNGVVRPAALRVLKADYTPFKDDFTQYFGPLSVGRVTAYSDFSWGDDFVNLTQTFMQQVVQSPTPVHFEVEMFP